MRHPPAQEGPVLTRVLHVSNTDIDRDSRIRKELKAVGGLPAVQVEVLGVPDDNQAGIVQLDGARYQKLRLASRTLRVLPRAVRYFIQLIEFTCRVVVIGRRIRPHIVHCHDTFPLLAGWILKRRTGCRLVYDAHELESDKNAQNFILSRATLRIEKFCWKQVDLLISVSDSIIDWYVRNLGAKPSVLVLNSPAIAESGPASGGLEDRENYLRRKYDIPEDHIVFVYLGLFCAGRGIQICLDAFASGPENAHVVFIGLGQLTETIREYSGRHANIHIHPAVPHDQVVSLVRSADYGLCVVERVSLSDYYCLPNKLFEYCFARIPVLASGFPEIIRVVEQYSLGVCCDPEPASVRAALTRLMKQTVSRVTSDIAPLSWEAQASRLTAAYRERLLASLAAPPAAVAR
jgi:glycosyltransferase involved in cell wall biosynthesis